MQLHCLCEGSAQGNWDPREGQQSFRPNSNGVGDRTTTLRRLLIGAAFSFLRPLLTYATPGSFPFLSVTHITKLKRFHRTATRAISGCLLFSPIPLLLSEASLPLLRVTQAHFDLSSYDRAFRLPTSFPISGLARLGVKPRLCRSSWSVFPSTHPLVLSSTSPRRALLACPSSLPWNLPFFTVESILFSPSSRSDSLLSRQGTALAHLDSLSFHDLVIWTDGSVPFRFGKAAWRTCQLLSLLH